MKLYNKLTFPQNLIFCVLPKRNSVFFFPTPSVNVKHSALLLFVNLVILMNLVILVDLVILANLVILMILVNLLLDMVILVNLCENMKSGFLESPPFQKYSICWFFVFYDDITIHDDHHMII